MKTMYQKLSLIQSSAPETLIYRQNAVKGQREEILLEFRSQCFPPEAGSKEGLHSGSWGQRVGGG